MSTGPLDYASAEYDALRPGEVVIWDSPAAAKVELLGSRMRWGAVILGAIFVVFGSIFVPIAPRISIFLYSFGLIGGVSIYVRDFRQEYHRTHRRVRLTNQRAIILDSRKAERRSVELLELGSIRREISRTRHRLDIAGSALEFAQCTDADMLLGSIVRLIAQSARRSGFRRSPATPLRPGGTMEQAINAMTHELKSGLQLQDGEVLLWSGRPRAWEGLTRSWWLGRLKTLVWSVIWASIVGGCAYLLWTGIRHAMIFVFAVISLSCLWACLHSLFIAPFKTASRRRRSRYYLTNLRTVIELQGSSTSLTSTFLDMASGTSLRLHDDGTGDVDTGGWHGGFERILDAREVHQRLIDAIRATGGPLHPLPPDADIDSTESNQD